MLDATRRRPEREVEEEVERVLRCRACAAEVARLRDRVTVGSGELHTFVNPQGQVFELVCFGRADGAAASGELTFEYSWFPGYAWRYANCRRCARQLGWRFEGSGRAGSSRESSGGSPFWGLDRSALLWP